MIDREFESVEFADRFVNWFNRPLGVTLTTFLALSGALTTFLRYNQYPALSPEIGLIVLLMALMSIGIGLAYRYTNWFGVALMIVIVAEAFLFTKMALGVIPQYLSPDFLFLVLVVVLIATALAIAYRLFTVALAQYLLILLVGTAFAELTTTSQWSGLAVLAAVLIARRHFLPIMAVFAIVLVVTNPFIGTYEDVMPKTNRSGAMADTEAARPTLAQSSNNKPFILHLLLDEHLGIEGFNSFTSDPVPIRNELLAFYNRRGFRVFGGAYSKHFHTRNAVPEILSLGMKPVDAKAQGTEKTIGPHPYFNEIEARGYPLTVLGPFNLSYCFYEQMRNCVPYQPNGPFPVAEFNLPPVEKAKFILWEYLRLSPSMRYINKFYNYSAKMLRYNGIPVPPVSFEHLSLAAASGLKQLEQITDELALAEPGEAYFAHVLLPHYPYVYDRNCSLKASKDWLYRESGGGVWPIAEREEAYAEQIRCTLRQLDLLLTALESSPAGDNYVAIIHGDHGSRIADVEPTVENIGEFTDRDLIAGFSTLFAVRYSSPQPGYVADHIPVDKLLKNLVENEFQAIYPDNMQQGPLRIILDNSAWEPTVEYELPGQWPAPQKRAR